MTTTYYRTKDGRADYGFSFEEVRNGTWRAYIVSQPPYGGRDESADPTHRLSDNGRRYVCWKPADAINSRRLAEEVASKWADLTQEYIRSGTRF